MACAVSILTSFCKLNSEVCRTAQPDSVEGISGSTATVEGLVSWANPNPPGQHSLWEETGVPGENPRLLVEQ